MRPTVRCSLISLVLVAAVGLAASAPAVAKNPNLVANPGFEESQFEPVSATGQPVLPTGWTVEGATILFDHTQNVYKEGKRSAAISGALGGGGQICDGSSGSQMCNPNPAKAATDQVPLRPFWVTETPIPIEAGKTYHFSTFVIMPSLNPEAGIPGEGAATMVRWLAGDEELLTVEGPSLLHGAKRIIGWKQISADLKAPPGADGVQLLLGHSNYTTTSNQVVYDVVEFSAL